MIKYSRPQIANGTGFTRGQRFVTLETAQALADALRDVLDDPESLPAARAAASALAAWDGAK